MTTITATTLSTSVVIEKSIRKAHRTYPSHQVKLYSANQTHPKAIQIADNLHRIIADKRSQQLNIDILKAMINHVVQKTIEKENTDFENYIEQLSSNNEVRQDLRNAMNRLSSFMQPNWSKRVLANIPIFKINLTPCLDNVNLIDYLHFTKLDIDPFYDEFASNAMYWY